MTPEEVAKDPLEEMKESKAVLPKVMKALTKYPRNESIVERSVALCYRIIQIKWI